MRGWHSKEVLHEARPVFPGSGIPGGESRQLIHICRMPRHAPGGRYGAFESELSDHADMLTIVVLPWNTIGVCEEFYRLPDDTFQISLAIRDLGTCDARIEAGEDRMVDCVRSDAHASAV